MVLSSEVRLLEICQAKFVKQDFTFTHFINKYSIHTVLTYLFNH